MSKPIVNYDFNKVEKNVETGKYPIYIIVRFGNVTQRYSIGLDLTNSEYSSLHKEPLTKKSRALLLKFKTAHERIKAIANLLIPFNPMAFSHIIFSATSEYANIYTDSDYSFDALKITSKWLEDYELMTSTLSSQSLHNCFTTKVPASEEENELINSKVIEIHSLLDNISNPQATLCLLKAIELL